MTAIEPGGVGEHAAEGVLADLGEVQFRRARLLEDVGRRPFHRLTLWWQPLPIWPVVGLGHEAGGDAEFAGDLLADLPVGDQPVGGVGRTRSYIQFSSSWPSSS